MSTPRIGLHAVPLLRATRATPPKILGYRTPSRFFTTSPAHGQRYTYGRFNQRGEQKTYSRFQHTAYAFRRWAARPTFYYEVGGLSLGLGGLYAYNLETVPVSGRRRFNIFGPDHERTMAQGETSQILNQFGGKVLSDLDPRTRQVKRVINRLIPVSGLADLDWEVVSSMVFLFEILDEVLVCQWSKTLNFAPADRHLRNQTVSSFTYSDHSI